MENIVKAVVIFLVFSFGIILVFSVLDEPVVSTINSFVNSSSKDISATGTTLITVWRMVPVVSLIGGLIWLMFWIHKREYETYYEKY